MGYASESSFELVKSLGGKRICELGDQELHGWHVRDHYEALGYQYVSIDCNGRATVCADLNVWPNKAASLEPFDVVTNFGTTEHIANQLAAFATVHHLMKPGGFAVHHIPTLHYLNHALVNVTPRFMLKLAHANGYEVVRAEIQESWLDQGLAFHYGPELDVFKGIDVLRRSTRAAMMLVIFRKRLNGPFVVPVDCDTAPGIDQAEQDAFAAGLISTGLVALSRGIVKCARRALRPIRRAIGRRHNASDA